MHGDAFTASDTAIADYLLNNHPKSLLQNASEIAKILNLNIATVTRFFMKLGYSSAREAMDDFREELEFIIDSPLDRYGEIRLAPGVQEEEIADLLRVEQENIAKTLAGVDMATLRAVAGLLSDARRKVFVVGAAKEHSVAHYLFKHLFSLRGNAFLVQEPHTINLMTSIDADSVCVIFDFRRYANTNRKVARYAKQAGAKIVTISDSGFCPTALLANYQFTAVTKSSNMFDSYTAVISLVNLVSAQILNTEGRDFKEQLDRLETVYAELNTFGTSK
ncbi:MAG: MurR/RpiR family transcriptional regulator [Candidatus Accumulibacter sp.]|nr:MurR/RpiR family transcriptional regulator [Accumulibacter sp.]